VLPVLRGCRVVRGVPVAPGSRMVPAPRMSLAPHVVPAPLGSHAVQGARGRRGYRSGDPARPGARVAARTRSHQKTLRLPAQPQISADLPEPGQNPARPELVRPARYRPARAHRTGEREPRATGPSCRRAGPGPGGRDVVVPGSGCAGPLLRSTDPMGPAGKGGPGQPGFGGRSADGTAVPSRNRHSAPLRPAYRRLPGRRRVYCRGVRRLPGPRLVYCGEVLRLPGARLARWREIRHLPGPPRAYPRSGRRRPGLD
jgi:hypothetical protein